MEQDNTLVSIITPVYNAQDFIQETVDSVREQMYLNWELLLIEDHSTDQSLEIIRKFEVEDQRIKVIQTPQNSGAAVARNLGLTNAKGRYIAFIDSDDLWEPNKLADQLEFMKQNDYGFTFTAMNLIDEESKLINKFRTVVSKIDYEFLLKNTLIGCSTVIIDKEIIGDFEMPLMRSRQDTATWLKILKQGHHAYGLGKALTRYRVSNNSLSSNKIKMAKQNWYMYRKVENLSLIKSSYVFIGYAYNAVMKRL